DVPRRRGWHAVVPGAARRSVPVPSLGGCGVGSARAALRRPRGVLRGGRRLLRSPRPRSDRDGWHRGRGVQSLGRAAEDDGGAGRQHVGGRCGMSSTEETARSLADRFITFLETGTAPEGLFSPDVFCDFTMPLWRLQAQGIEEVVRL